MILEYKRNPRGTVQAAYSGIVRVGYIDKGGDERWLWSLNTIQPKGGRASGIEKTEALAKDALDYQWALWLTAAGLQLNLKEQPDVERPANRDPVGTAS
jgi:hypothetical protein